MHEVDVEVDAQQVPDQHAHPEAHKSNGAKFGVVDQDGAGKAVEGEPCPEDVGEELDEAGDLLVGADDGEEGGDCSESIDADQHEQGEVDLPVSHLIQKRWFWGKVVKVLEEDRLIKDAVWGFDKNMVEDTAIVIKTMLAIIWRVPRT